MSLWLESLSMELYDCGDNAAERARCILAYLSMPTPHSWWERAMQTGNVRPFAPLLSDLQLELSKAPGIAVQPGASLLVALAFIDDDGPQPADSRFDDPKSNYMPAEYLARAKMVLANRPELAKIGKMIEKAMENFSR